MQAPPGIPTPTDPPSPPAPTVSLPRPRCLPGNLCSRDCAAPEERNALPKGRFESVLVLIPSVTPHVPGNLRSLLVPPEIAESAIGR